MVWILWALLSQANAAYQQDYLKLKICEELRVNMREMPVETCFAGKFKFTTRDDITDFRWRLRKGGVFCTGSIYPDASSVHIDGCYR